MSFEDPSTWAPDLTSEQLWSERSFFSGVLVGAVAYGVHATLFFTALKLLWERPRMRPGSGWRDTRYGWIAYIVVVFAVSSLGNGMQFKFAQMSFIDNRNYPNGPSAYLVQQGSAKQSVTSSSSYIVTGWLQDSLILYRYWIIYNRSIPALIGPAVLFLGELVVSFWLLVGLMTGGKIRAGVSIELLTAYFTISIAMNVFLTLAIVTKLLLVRRRISKHLQHSTQYVSISAMLVESAALYAICGVVFLVPWGLKDAFEQAVLPTLGQAESIAPLLIIVRVAQGKAWSADTESRLNESTLRFGTGTSPRTNTIALSTTSVTESSLHPGELSRQFKPPTNWTDNNEETGVNFHKEIMKSVR